MPELPEVETVVRGLQNTIVGESIMDLEVPWEKALVAEDPYESIVGKSITGVSRRAKYIIIKLDMGALLVHLRMTGKLTPIFPEKHVTVILHFESGNSLYFQDTRKFGRMVYTDDPIETLAHIGPEPLGDQFTPDEFYKMLQGKNRLIKPLLLDQTFLAGLGNIYVDEALFQSGIQPLSIASTIPKDRASSLHSAIQSILSASIEAQGTTVLNFSHGDNQSGTYQAALQVYGRKDEPCLICNTPITKISVGQRGTHYCSSCQILYKAKD
ncbi:MAG: DNA-formamidopyrimidine glycosylase [Candidatus Marinimicrobia bacterium]|nr:DNA-formamidopyrimidine glycosylase [Candidatus Neomarinimicrobiota bacterium]MBT4360021.1 DNA-formamidopyrimidine glycosylase [Candidatus Neomarinimicrobiota bacterium]MBT4714916.1 DNA-formamidopyrimidine glycosylase [Candidatus Neomarinimicrobiota bacterium]MBT4945691.1 DNA-formamidopyrimidine glycosylase [Candidatus Neomarinimicrobiota bacterium]MBT5269288.1 DNA-formamidopyrimidine glycosylase [Candidatus Neomarinimicrobiota bacterium]